MRRSRLLASALAGLGCVLVVSARADDLAQGATYHADAARSGNFTAPGLTWASAATLARERSFDGATTGDINAQPLYWRAPGADHGMVVVATDRDVVQAFDSVSGASLWRAVLGTPGAQAVPGCGASRDHGVLGTPVIDPAAGVIYVAGSIAGEGDRDQFGIWAISLADGAVRAGWPVMVAPGIRDIGGSFTPIIHDQHTALTLVGGTVYAGFAANVGDCSPYHGWIVGIDTGRAVLASAWRSRAPRGGVWSPGGVVFDGTSLFAATGNAVEPGGWADGEAVFRLAADLRHATSTADYFVPADFAALDRADLDLGSTSPLPVELPLPGGGTARWLVQFGKDGLVYVLDRANLGGIGGALLSQAVAEAPVVSAPAMYPTASGTMFALNGTGTNCPGSSTGLGVLAISLVATPAPVVTTAWCVPQGSPGIPIVTTTDGASQPIVWVTVQGSSARLEGYRGDTGALVATAWDAGGCVATTSHHPTLLVAEGRIFSGGDERLCAFAYTPADR